MVDERRQQLLGIQLRGLVTEHLGVSIDAEPHGFGAGSALMVGDAAWTLIDGPARRRLGAALAWAVRQDAASLNVIAAEDGGTVARRAAGFSMSIEVWFPDGRALLPVVAAPPETQREADPNHLELVSLITEGGATPRIEHGVVTGEVRGLEVCRVVDEPTVGNFVELSDVVIEPADVPDDIDARVSGRTAAGVMLEVGVGANDREAFQLLHGHVPTVDALASVVDAVSSHRQVATRQHPLNRMATERFLRWQVETEPHRLGLAELHPAEPPIPRMSMKHTEPCVGVGVDTEGRATAVVFSSGVDLDLIAFTADVTLGLEPQVERVVVAAPERDLMAITHDLAALLTREVEVIGLPDDA